MQDSASFGQWLRKRRRAMDLTQDALARQVGCAAITIRKLEADEMRPSRQMAELLAEHLGVPAHEREAFIRLAHAGQFPPARGPAAARQNLRVPLTSFIGREREIAQVETLLQATRLLTLTGTGGVGKTRLALEVAGKNVNQFQDGVSWATLDSLSDPQLIGPTLASALGLRDASSELAGRLADFLRGKELLLLLDNCDQLIEECAQWADRLLPAAPGLKILATSRERLGLFGETVWPVPPMALPAAQKTTSLASSMEYDSVRLFVERARAVKPDFSLTEANAPAVVRVCAQLDGIPLAIELAAARVRLLTVEHIAERLADRFKLLTTGSRTALPRHQTLRAAIDWSYDLLPQSARTLLGRLSVFAGGFTLEAAERICSSERIAPADVLDLVGRLLDRSLIQVREQGGEERFGLLETIREYAGEKLAESGESDSVRSEMLAYFLSLARAGEPTLTGAEAPGWLSRMELEHDNLRAALNWSARSGAVESGLALATALLRFWRIHGPVSEGRAWLARLLLAGEGSAELALRARGLFAAANLAWWQSDLAEARPLYEASLELGRQLADKRIVGWALFALGALNADEGNRELAQSLCEEALVLLEQAGDKWGAGEAINVLGLLARKQGDLARARRLFEREIAATQGEGSELGVAMASSYLAYVELDAGEPEKARILIERALRTDVRISARNYSVDRLEAMAVVAAAQHDVTRAARLLGASERQRAEMGYPRNTLAQEFYLRYLKDIHAQAEYDSAVEEAWLEGQAMPLERAIEYALERTGPYVEDLKD